MSTTRTPATDPLTHSARDADERTWAVHWVYPDLRVTPLETGMTTIGRDPKCRVVLDDTRVSRQHATLHLAHQGATPLIKDNGSSNRLFVDGQECTEAALVDGSVLRVGDTIGVVVHAEHSADVPRNFGTAEAPYVGSGKVAEALRFAERAAATKDPVFISAETGTGKEYLARLVHGASGREGDFVAINCASLQTNLALSTLFGHQRGAFTGADRNVSGVFLAASRGTLFLDGVAELAPDAQAMLLRAAQDGEITPLGATKSFQVDVRLICATHVDLLDRACNGGFRADLYYRLTTHQVRLPALRERREDIVELFCTYAGVPRRAMKPTVVQQLLCHTWPGNIRELQNVASTLKVREPEPEKWTTTGLRAATRSLWAPTSAPAAPGNPELPDKAAELTREAWLALYVQNGGVAARVAAATGYSPSAVKRHLARFGIKRD